MQHTQGYEVDVSIRLAKKPGTTRQDIYTTYYNCRHLNPLYNVIDYKIADHHSRYSIDLKLYVLGTSLDEVHLLVESKLNEFFTSERLGATVQGIDIHGVKVIHTTRTYRHNKDNIDVNFVVVKGDMLLFEIELEDEVVSTEDDETSTIRIDINKNTLAHGIYTTFSEDYDIGADIDPESASIDVEEIVPFLMTTRHQYEDMTEVYDASYAERRARGEVV